MLELQNATALIKNVYLAKNGRGGVSPFLADHFV